MSDETRFQFGQNWLDFAQVLNSERIREAENSLKTMLRRERLDGLSFLDIGCGSGLFSLAAHNLGASVTSFDFDVNSVACCRAVKDRYGTQPNPWHVQQGSVLDTGFCASLGKFDIVYSWGVLHHTGSMWNAIANAIGCVDSNGGILFISIYNDQGVISKRWTAIKKIYNEIPSFFRPVYALLAVAPRELKDIMRSLLRLKPGAYVRKIKGYKSQRGMSYWHDIVDWVGGYPFEVATPDEIFSFVRRQGFELRQLTTSFGGCNQYVFEKVETCHSSTSADHFLHG